MSMGKRSLLVTIGLMTWYSLMVGWAYLVYDTNGTLYFWGLLGFALGFLLILGVAIGYRRQPSLTNWYGLQLFPLFVVVAVMVSLLITLGEEVGLPAAAAVTIVMWPVYLFLTVLTAMLIHGIQRLAIRKSHQD